MGNYLGAEAGDAYQLLGQQEEEAAEGEEDWGEQNLPGEVWSEVVANLAFEDKVRVAHTNLQDNKSIN